jgi:hypothetical protein
MISSSTRDRVVTGADEVDLTGDADQSDRRTRRFCGGSLDIHR